MDYLTTQEENPREGQMNFAGQVETTQEEAPPGEVMAAMQLMETLMGGGIAPLSDVEPPPPHPMKTMLKSHELSRVREEAFENHVEVFDIADPADKARVDALYDQASSKENNIELVADAPQYFLDPNCKRGFRVLLLMRWWKTKKVLDVDGKIPFEVNEGRRKDGVAPASAPV